MSALLVIRVPRRHLNGTILRKFSDVCERRHCVAPAFYVPSALAIESTGRRGSCGAPHAFPACYHCERSVLIYSSTYAC